MPRFLHTADWHLNALRTHKGYLKRNRRMMDSVLKIAREESVDFIIIAGDIYDRLDITHAERQVFSEWLADCEIPVVAVSGNHEKRSGEVGDTGLSYLAALRGQLSSHLVYDGPPTMIYQMGCYFVLLPYQGWTDQELHLILQLLIRKGPRFEPAEHLDHPIIVVMHEAVSGCKTDTGVELTKNHAIRIDKSIPEITYWALGDIHVSQKILDNAYYSGSPHQINFGEIQDKGVLIVDTDNPSEPKFRPVDSTPLVSLSVYPVGGWPSDDEAFVQYTPEGEAVDAALLPPHVRYNPKMAGSMYQVQVAEAADALHVGNQHIFEGLDSCLARANLKPELYPLAWRLAQKLARTLKVHVDLPERYREDL